ncbi:ABC transporter family protein [Tritrichomonas foetus]|uniref:ABC transporter family protein n=1 Tax=Tritrichomonas foetus TaxID=1144522 RepID=A0A1J4KP14_9EUKA|nr:ABC transporter family protein [Tritrichomonas foetus]|eukprot:OHT12664.1 ABC transporter family protein [Tritrichomonas foetus]
MGKKGKKSKNYEPLPNENNDFSFYDIPPPSFVRSFLALLKRSLIIRQNTSSALIIMILMPLYVISFSELDIGEKIYMNNINTPVEIPIKNNFLEETTRIEKRNNKYSFFIYPDLPRVRDIFQNFNLNMTFINNSKSIIPNLYGSTIGIGLVTNGFDKDFEENPKISFVTKDFQDDDEQSLILSILQSFSKGNISINISKSEFAGKSITKSQFSSDSILSMLIVINIISVVLSELRLYLNEKESKIIKLFYINRCSHLCFWTSTIFVSVLSCTPSCVILAYYFTAQQPLNESDFSLIFLFLLSFSLSVTLMIFAFSQFISTSKSSRSFKTLFTVFSAAFSFMNTLDSKSNHIFINLIRKLLLIAIPQSIFSQGITSLFIYSRSVGPILWKDVSRRSLSFISYYFSMFLSCSLFYLTILFISEIYNMSKFHWKRLIRIVQPVKRFYQNLKEKESIEKDDFVIKVHSLTKNYGDTKALDNISYTLQRGDFVALIGPNGSGKSTMINIITSIIEADNGGITVFDNNYDINDSYYGFDTLLKYCGICFQENILIPQLTILQHLYLFGTLYGIPYLLLNERINKITEDLDLISFLHRKASDLSGGVKRKLCIAISILAKPPILILDEPTAGVDINSRQKIWNLLKKAKTSICLITSHSLEEAEQVWNKLFVMKEGKLAFMGSEGEARSKFKCGYLLKIVDDVADDTFLLDELKNKIGFDVMKGDSFQSYILPDNENMIYLFDILEKCGIAQYTLSLQALEEMILKYYETSSHAILGLDQDMGINDEIPDLI